MAHPHPSCIAQDLIDTSGNHAPHEPEGPRPGADAQVKYDGKGEDDGEGEICAEVWDVTVDAELWITYFQGAICEWAEKDVVRRGGCRPLL